MWGEQTGSCSQSKIFTIFRLHCEAQHNRESPVGAGLGWIWYSEYTFQRPHVFHDWQGKHRTPCPRPLLWRPWNSTDNQRKPAVCSYCEDSLSLLLMLLSFLVIRFMAAGVFSKCMTSLNDYCCRDPFVHHRINDEIKKWIGEKAPGGRESHGCPKKRISNDFIGWLP